MDPQWYERALALVAKLMQLQPEPESRDGEALDLLATAVRAYEKARFPILPEEVARVEAGALWRAVSKDLSAINGLVNVTRLLSDHPQAWNGPCECQECRSYMADPADPAAPPQEGENDA